MRNWVEDENGNRASVKFFGSEADALEALASLKNCKNCEDCKYCEDCYDGYGCKDEDKVKNVSKFSTVINN